MLIRAYQGKLLHGKKVAGINDPSRIGPKHFSSAGGKVSDLARWGGVSGVSR